MAYFINCKTSQGRETVDEFETRKEALEMLREYQMAYTMNVYLSSRCCANWQEDRKGQLKFGG
jgi:hypothetical protein